MARELEWLANIGDIVQTRAEQAGLTDPSGFAASFHRLMKGSIISTAEGDASAAELAKVMASTCSLHTVPAAE